MKNIRLKTAAVCALVFLLTHPAGAQTVRETRPEAFNESNSLRPLLQQYCYKCHSGDQNNGDVSLDVLAVDGDELSGESWASVLDVINSGDMPPEDEPQLTDDDRKRLVDGLNELLRKASQSQVTTPPVLRRLTRAQYTHTLQSLLGLDVDFGDALPEDGKSKTGFSNNADVLQTTALHFDYYEKIARSALDKAIVSGPKPETTRFRIEFGRGIDGDSSTALGQEIVGYQAIPVLKNDFKVDVLDDQGEVCTASDEKQQRDLQAFKNKIGIGMRGSAADRFQVVNDGILLFSAVPHRERVPKSWQGPSPNLKVLVQNDFSRVGDFRMKIAAQRSQAWGDVSTQGLITLRDPVAADETEATIKLTPKNCDSVGSMELQDSKWLVPTDVAGTTFAEFTFSVLRDGIYQVDFVHPFAEADLMPSFEICIDEKLRLQERLQLRSYQQDIEEITTPITLVRLSKGDHQLQIGGRFFPGFKEVRITPMEDESPIAIKLKAEASSNREKFASKLPSIAAFAGARTDDGMDYLRFGQSVVIDAELGDVQSLEFRGRLENMPLPVFEPESRDKLSNIAIFGIWNDYLVKSVDDSGPPALIRSIEIELPYFPVWPPESHTEIFPKVADLRSSNRSAYTKKVLEKFITRAFRRPVAGKELDRYFEFWKAIRGDHEVYEESVKEVLVAVLCSPNFLYMREPVSNGQVARDSAADGDGLKAGSGSQDPFMLASKLSYFLWNSPPDETLLNLASEGQLREQLSAQTDRMIDDPRVLRMIHAFAGEWLRVDRFENMRINTRTYSDFTRFVKSDMNEETWGFLHYVLKNDLKIDNLIDSYLEILNQNLAEFYGVSGVNGNHFRPVRVLPDQHRGGLLSQGTFLAGHSDGQQAHPIKRAVWLKERILGDPPPPAPPNVPDLDPETPGFEKLTLKQQLEVHRNKPSCINCHKKIDPYGVVFQNFDAVGRFQVQTGGQLIDATSTLPDGTKINGVAEMKRYILEEQHHQFCRSLVEHLLAYGLGRDIRYSDQASVDEIVRSIEKGSGGFRSVFREIILSAPFSGRN